MSKILFVTGTDTGVGKTIACAWLALREAAQNRRVLYIKPVQTGVADNDPGGDAAFVRRTTGIAAIELMRFADPLAPAEAAARAGVTIELDRLVEGIIGAATFMDLVLVEGAGGQLVPLTQKETMADLATALGAEVVVVTRPSLGTLNHTALTLEAAQRRALNIAMLVVSGVSEKPDLTERTNLRRLRALGHPLEVIPHLDGVSVDDLEPGEMVNVSRASAPPTFG